MIPSRSATTLAVVDVREPDERLSSLVAVIAEHHERAMEAGRALLEHAIACGDALLEAKALVPPGEWTQWVETNLPDGVRLTMTRNYMRLAALKERVDPDLSVAGNIRLLAGVEGVAKGTPRIAEDIKDEARRMKDEGVPIAEIARRLDTTKHSVRAWTIPGEAEKFSENSKRSHERSAERRRVAVPHKVPRDQMLDDAEAHERSRAERASRYGEPGRAAVGQAVHRLAAVKGRAATREALLDLSAIAESWAGRLAA
jgi:hypothetical protein